MTLAEEDLAQIASLFNTKLEEFGTAVDDKLNKAITKRLSAAEQKILSEQNKVLEGFKTSNVPAPPPATPPGNEGDVRLKTLEAMVRESNAKFEDAERRAKAATEKNREAAKRTKVADLFSKAGVTNPEIVEIGVGFLVDSAKAVSYESDDEANDRLVFHSDNGDPVELATGFNAWLKTDKAKHFLPPKGTRGSGSVRSNGVVTPPTQEELAYAALRDGLSKL